MSSTSRKWLLNALVAVLAIGTIVLTLLALDHVRTRPTDRDVAPVPTFSQPLLHSPSPAPSESPPTISHDRSQERFLTVSAGVLWRGIAGQCGSVEPVLERSEDSGQTWIDVTPRYLGISQLVALNPFADGQVEIIALMGQDCGLQALRTFTQGQFWESNADLLAASQYVNPFDTGNIVRSNSSLGAPCTDVRGLRTADSILTVVCDGTAFLLDQSSEWFALPSTSVTALSVQDAEIVVAYISESCAGLTITHYTSTGQVDASRSSGCAEVAQPGAPTAIAASDDDIFVWAGAAITVSQRLT